MYLYTVMSNISYRFTYIYIWFICFEVGHKYKVSLAHWDPKPTHPNLRQPQKSIPYTVSDCHQWWDSSGWTCLNDYISKIQMITRGWLYLDDHSISSTRMNIKYIQHVLRIPDDLYLDEWFGLIWGILGSRIPDPKRLAECSVLLLWNPVSDIHVRYIYAHVVDFYARNK